MDIFTPHQVATRVTAILASHEDQAQQVKADWRVFINRLNTSSLDPTWQEKHHVRAMFRPGFVDRLAAVKRSQDVEIQVLRSRVYNNLQGHQPTDEESTLNRRDASSRARRLSTQEQAGQLLSDATFLLDDTLAHAVGSMAAVNGWEEVFHQYSTMYGQSALALQSLAVIDYLHRDNSVNLLNNITYSPSYFND